MSLIHKALNTLPPALAKLIVDHVAVRLMRKHGKQLRVENTHYDIVDRHNRVIRVARRHAVYLQDILGNFDDYFDAVKPLCIGDKRIVDYTTPAFHEVVGFDLHPIHFPSFAEPINTTLQYLDFAGLQAGDVAIDLGAYCGLSAILMDQRVAPSGRVIAVDADLCNLHSARINLAEYRKRTGRSIALVEAAIWKDTNGVTFLEEGNMGSSVREAGGGFRGRPRKVSTHTLSSLVKSESIHRVDFIKCDVEGAERLVFADDEFFKAFRPKIIIEPHVVDGENTEPACQEELKRRGYSIRRIKQRGSHLPLLECTPG